MVSDLHDNKEGRVTNKLFLHIGPTSSLFIEVWKIMSEIHQNKNVYNWPIHHTTFYYFNMNNILSKIWPLSSILHS